jgi:hypothetical protein
MKNIKTYEDFVNEEINLRKGLMGAALGAGLALSNPAQSQINKYNPVNPIKKELSDFDSTQVSTLTLKEMIGQDFIVVEEPYSFKFYKSIKDLKTDSYSKSKNIKNVFGRTIRLLEVIEDDTLDYDKLINKGTDAISCILKFEDINTKENLYYNYFNSVSALFGAEYSIKKPSSLPFISTGYLEKFKRILKGTYYNKFYDTLKVKAEEFGHNRINQYSDAWINWSRIDAGESSNYDIVTGVKLSDEDKNLCKFDDVVINEKNKKLAFKFLSDKNSFLIDIPDNYFTNMKIK